MLRDNLIDVLRAKIAHKLIILAIRIAPKSDAMFMIKGLGDYLESRRGGSH